MTFLELALKHNVDINIFNNYDTFRHDISVAARKGNQVASVNISKFELDELTVGKGDIEQQLCNELVKNLGLEV